MVPEQATPVARLTGSRAGDIRDPIFKDMTHLFFHSDWKVPFTRRAINKYATIDNLTQRKNLSLLHPKILANVLQFPSLLL